jgi:curved DNA-binding protein CbpA
MYYEELRNFRRYLVSSDCKLQVGDNTFIGKTIDYSPSGACLSYSSSTILAIGTQAELTIDDTDIQFKCEVVWVDESKDGFRAGVKRTDGLTGSLRDFNLADVLIGLQKTTKTGVFKVTSDTIEKLIYIRNGDMIFASSNNKEDRLGEMLLKEGNITIEQYMKASELIKTTKVRLGRILVDLGLKPKDVFLAVKRQIEGIVLSIFDIEDGTFSFDEGPLPTEELITLNMSAANIIYRGIKRLNKFFDVQKIVPSMDSVLNISPNPMFLFQDISFDEQDKKILLLVNGKHSLKTILSLAPFKEFETIKIICAFLNIGLIRVMREGEHPVEIPLEELISEPATEITENFPQKVEEFQGALEHMGHYEVLGLERDATFEQLTLSYFRLSKEFHPDRHFSLPSKGIKDKLITILSHIYNAYKTLSDPIKRSEYDKTLSPAGVLQAEEDTPVREEDTSPSIQEKEHGAPVSSISASVNEIKESASDFSDTPEDDSSDGLMQANEYSVPGQNVYDLDAEDSESDEAGMGETTAEGLTEEATLGPEDPLSIDSGHKPEDSGESDPDTTETAYSAGDIETPDSEEAEIPEPKVYDLDAEDSLPDETEKGTAPAEGLSEEATLGSEDPSRIDSDQKTGEPEEGGLDTTEPEQDDSSDETLDSEDYELPELKTYDLDAEFPEPSGTGTGKTPEEDLTEETKRDTVEPLSSISETEESIPENVEAAAPDSTRTIQDGVPGEGVSEPELSDADRDLSRDKEEEQPESPDDPAVDTGVKEQTVTKRKGPLKAVVLVSVVLILAATAYFVKSYLFTGDDNKIPPAAQNVSPEITTKASVHTGILPAFHRDAIRKILNEPSPET